MREFAIILKELRELKGITQTELAKNIGASRSSICRYEKGEMSPDIRVAKKIADSLGTTVEYLSGSDLKSSKNELPKEYLELANELYRRNISTDKVKAMINILK